ncbi:MAG: SDR family oxidoreductase [Alphaproteobacteria bacterium]|nr:SDR family oxidoreductase [Alphaproteobacteria bacterium]
MKNIHDLTGKTALITGASSGLGQSFAQTLARYGAKVVLAARRLDKLEDTVEAIKAAGGEAVAVVMDVTDPETVKEGFIQAEKAFGTMEIVIANAGVGPAGTTLEMSPENWSSVIDANLNGVWYVAQEAGRRMIEAKVSGSIVNTASILALRGRGGAPAYAASKAGVAHLTKVLALEWAEYGIRVNALAPGYFESDLNRNLLNSERGKKLIEGIPMKRTGEYEELDGALLLLSSGAGAFMTGVVIPVDGGHLVNSL